MDQANDTIGGEDGGATLETIRAVLLEIVQEGELSRPGGVHLTHVGGQFGKRMSAPFDAYLSHLALSRKLVLPVSDRKLFPFIQKYCTDIFSVENPRDNVFLLTTIKDTKSKPAAITFTPQITSSYSGTFPRYLKPVWVAFIRPLPENFRRFLRIGSSGVTFQDIPEPGVPDDLDGSHEVERQFIVETPPTQPMNGPLVNSSIQNWIASTSVPLDVLVATEETSAGASADILDLLRIIDALPPDVAGRWLIPAEVLRRLRKP